MIGGPALHIRPHLKDQLVKRMFARLEFLNYNMFTIHLEIFMASQFCKLTNPSVVGRGFAPGAGNTILGPLGDKSKAVMVFAFGAAHAICPQEKE